MFVKNFNTLILANSYALFNTVGSSTFAVTDLLGNKFTPGYVCYSQSNDGKNSRILSIDSIILGNSDNNVNYNQYNIQGTEIVLSSPTINRNYGLNEDGTMVAYYELKGTPQRSDTIKEVAFVKKIYNASTSADVMIRRDVLNTPIIVTEGVEIKIIFNVKFLIQ